MKILITGSSRADVGATRPALSYVTALDLLELTLKQHHYVERRAVTPSDSFDKFDRIFVGLYAPLAFASTEFCGAMWALGCRPDSIAVLNDWNIKYTFDAINFILGPKKSTSKREPWSYLLEGGVKRSYRDEWDETSMENSMKGLMAGHHRLLVPVFPWANHLKLPIPCLIDKRYYFDPSIVLADNFMAGRKMNDQFMRPPRPWKNRAKQWVLAALGDHSRWASELPNLSWDVINLGNEKAGFIRLPEYEVTNLMGRARGALSFPYPHAGSGWWRARIVYAACQRSLLAGEERELLPMMGDLYRTPSELEEYSDQSQQQLAREWSESFFARIWTHDYLDNFLRGLLA